MRSSSREVLPGDNGLLRRHRIDEQSPVVKKEGINNDIYYSVEHRETEGKKAFSISASFLFSDLLSWQLISLYSSQWNRWLVV